MLYRNLGPVLHRIVTFPGMILEWLHTPFRRLEQESDWRQVTDRLPGLEGYLRMSDQIQSELQAAYTDYVANVSSSLIALSLNRAAFVMFLTKLLQPKRILDLGSGFSSYVFRMYSAASGACNVISVDDSEHWLKATENFLNGYHLSTSALISLDRLEQDTHGLASVEFDLCLLDIGNIPLRKRILPPLISAVRRKNGILILDDFHIPGYRRYLRSLCRTEKVSLYSLRKITRRRLSHAALVMP